MLLQQRDLLQSEGEHLVERLLLSTKSVVSVGDRGELSCDHLN